MDYETLKREAAKYPDTMTNMERMKAYAIDYSVKGHKAYRLVEAKDLKSAKTKIGRKHGYKDGRMIKVERVSVVGYF